MYQKSFQSSRGYINFLNKVEPFLVTHSILLQHYTANPPSNINLHRPQFVFRSFSRKSNKFKVFREQILRNSNWRKLFYDLYFKTNAYSCKFILFEDLLYLVATKCCDVRHQKRLDLILKINTSLGFYKKTRGIKLAHI